MSNASDKPAGPDFTAGVPLNSIPDTGILAGHVGDDPVIVGRTAEGFAAISAKCSHYSGPLEKGLRVGDGVYCPWHHACFDLRTGKALKAPALAPVDRWKVEEHDGKVFIREKLAPVGPAQPAETPDRQIVIVGGGAAGFAAAQRLRELGFDGGITMLSADKDAPYDRPNVSKDFLAGSAEPEWMPLRDDAFYKKHDITLRLDVTVDHVDPAHGTVTLDSGERLTFDTLLLATGAEPVRPDGPGFDGDHVFTVRTMQDSQAIIDSVEKGDVVAVLGSSFIGLEVAASLRQRKIDVHVIGSDHIPMENRLGPALGRLIQGLHEDQGVTFHLGRKATGYTDGAVRLDNGGTVPATKVVLGLGVKPRLELAEAAGLKVDGGVLVDTSMRTSANNIFAAGDIARFPGLDGTGQRVEHWVVAQRHGQVAAAAMLGVEGGTYDEAPFFWSKHYKTQIRYMGHAERWDRIEEIGSVADKDAEVRYFKGDREVAVATVGRDLDALKAAERLSAHRRKG